MHPRLTHAPYVATLLAAGLLTSTAALGMNGLQLSHDTSVFEEICMDENSRVIIPLPDGEECPEGTIRRFEEEYGYTTPVAEEDSEHPWLIAASLDGAWSIFRFDSGKYTEVVSGIDGSISVPTFAALDLEGDGSVDLVVADTEAGELLLFRDVADIDGWVADTADETATAPTDMELGARNDGNGDILEVWNSNGDSADLEGSLQDVSF